MPIYQTIIEIDDPNTPKGLIDYVEYIEAKFLIDAATAAVESAKRMDGELKSVRYIIPTPRKI